LFVAGRWRYLGKGRRAGNWECRNIVASTASLVRMVMCCGLRAAGSERADAEASDTSCLTGATTEAQVELMADARELRRTLAAELGSDRGRWKSWSLEGRCGSREWERRNTMKVFSTDSQIAGVDPAGHPPLSCSCAKLLTNNLRGTTKEPQGSGRPSSQGGRGAGCWMLAGHAQQRGRGARAEASMPGARPFNIHEEVGRRVPSFCGPSYGRLQRMFRLFSNLQRSLGAVAKDGSERPEKNTPPTFPTGRHGRWFGTLPLELPLLVDPQIDMLRLSWQLSAAHVECHQAPLRPLRPLLSLHFEPLG
jgi:hypothetical protein